MEKAERSERELEARLHDEVAAARGAAQRLRDAEAERRREARELSSLQAQVKFAESDEARDRDALGRLRDEYETSHAAALEGSSAVRQWKDRCERLQVEEQRLAARFENLEQAKRRDFLGAEAAAEAWQKTCDSQKAAFGRHRTELEEKAWGAREEAAEAAAALRSALQDVEKYRARSRDLQARIPQAESEIERLALARDEWRSRCEAEVARGRGRCEQLETQTREELSSATHGAARLQAAVAQAEKDLAGAQLKLQELEAQGALQGEQQAEGYRSELAASAAAAGAEAAAALEANAGRAWALRELEDAKQLLAAERRNCSAHEARARSAGEELLSAEQSAAQLRAAVQDAWESKLQARNELLRSHEVQEEHKLALEPVQGRLQEVLKQLDDLESESRSKLSTLHTQLKEAKEGWNSEEQVCSSLRSELADSRAREAALAERESSSAEKHVADAKKRMKRIGGAYRLASGQPSTSATAYVMR